MDVSCDRLELDVSGTGASGPPEVPGRGVVRGTDPTAPDIAGARKRHPDWTFWKEGERWHAKKKDGSSHLSGLSLESLEGKISRVRKTGASGSSSQEEGPGGQPAGGST
jgi:hypothetical protein